jgi:hypothetical protein
MGHGTIARNAERFPSVASAGALQKTNPAEAGFVRRLRWVGLLA